MWSMSSHHWYLSMKPTQTQLEIKLKEKYKKDPMGSIPPRSKTVLANNSTISVCHHLIQARLLLNKRPSCRFPSVGFVCEGQNQGNLSAYKCVQFMSGGKKTVKPETECHEIITSKQTRDVQEPPTWYQSGLLHENRKHKHQEFST